jgi:hypothetical protein
VEPSVDCIGTLTPDGDAGFHDIGIPGPDGGSGFHQYPDEVKEVERYVAE